MNLTLEPSIERSRTPSLESDVFPSNSLEVLWGSDHEYIETCIYTDSCLLNEYEWESSGEENTKWSDNKDVLDLFFDSQIVSKKKNFFLYFSFPFLLSVSFVFLLSVPIGNEVHIFF